MAGLLNLLGLTSTSPLVIDQTYKGERTTDVIEQLVIHIRALENDLTFDKRSLSLFKMLIITVFRVNPF